MSAHGVLAATLVEPGKYELREYPLPEPAQGCVLVKMEMSGICGTDRHTYQGFVTQYGDRVVVGASVSCGQCYYCAAMPERNPLRLTAFLEKAG
jgi:threonine dehydrogenase-like Zn-dependent dehydrogenase